LEIHPLNTGKFSQRYKHSTLIIFLMPEPSLSRREDEIVFVLVLRFTVPVIQCKGRLPRHVHGDPFCFAFLRGLCVRTQYASIDRFPERDSGLLHFEVAPAKRK